MNAASPRHVLNREILIGSLLVSSWLGMQEVHELGHMVGAWLTGGMVTKVVLDPLSISRTDVDPNPQPLIVVWSGPIMGVVLPVFAWAVAAFARFAAAFVLRFFAGFCLIANGVYLGIGSLSGIGDCGTLLQHGAAIWQLWAFGAICAPLGFVLWNGEGKHFGLGNEPQPVSATVAYGVLGIAVIQLVAGVSLSGR